MAFGAVKTRKLVFSAMCIALASAASMLKIYRFPFGGSVTLFSMLFACLPGYFYGLPTGLAGAAAYGILQFVLEPYVLLPIQVVVDYFFAFTSLGLSGLFARAKHGLIRGYLAAVAGRYLFAVLSGWLFFREYTWEGWAALPYSLVYNGCYIFAEAILTIVILSIPAVSDIFRKTKQTALHG